MLGGAKKCSRCGCLCFSLKQHTCSEEMVHAHEIGPYVFPYEWRSYGLGTQYKWSHFDTWLRTPAGQFAEYLTKRSKTN